MHAGLLHKSVLYIHTLEQLDTILRLTILYRVRFSLIIVIFHGAGWVRACPK